MFFASPITGRQVGNYENNIHFPKDEKMILTLIELYDVSADYLFSLTKSKNYRLDSDTIKAYNDLPSEIKLLANDYIEFLATKYNNKT